MSSTPVFEVRQRGRKTPAYCALQDSFCKTSGLPMMKHRTLVPHHVSYDGQRPVHRTGRLRIMIGSEFGRRCFAFLSSNICLCYFADHERGVCLPALLFWKNRNSRQTRFQGLCRKGLRRKGRTMFWPTHKERWEEACRGQNGYIPSNTHSMSSIKTLALVRYMSRFVSTSFLFFYCTISAHGRILCLVDSIELVMSDLDYFKATSPTCFALNAVQNGPAPRGLV